MGILSSLFSGITGLTTSGQQISVVSDNIANVNTVGFKASRADFVDVLSGSLSAINGSTTQIGAGSRLSEVEQNFTQGSLESTNITTDLAVDGGGFFILQDSTGRYYSRAGMMRVDPNNLLVNEQGQSVLGYGVTAAGIPTNALGAIDLSTIASVPRPSQTVEVNVNLDPNDTTYGAASTAFDTTDPVSTSNFQTGVTIYDSLGNPRNVQMYFVRDDTTPNTWYFYAGTSRNELDLPAYGATSTVATDDDFFVVQSGTLEFNTDGTLLDVDNTQLTIDYDLDGNGALDGAPQATPFATAGYAWNAGAAATTVLALDFGTPTAAGGTGADQTTQFGGSAAPGANSFVRFVDQDGYSAGSLQAISIDDDGFVTGAFSNGQSQQLAQVALATFPAISGLERVGRNNWVETRDSGQAVVGSPNQSSFGAIRSGFLEQSNSDLAEQFVKLIIAQRAFQANTRTISTTNELLSQLVVLGQ